MIAILLASILYFIPLIETIDVTLEGLECRIGQNEYQKKVTIQIEGTYKKYLFQEDEFIGMITVSGYDFSKKGEFVEFKVFDGIGQITYFGVDEGKPYLETLGGIAFSPKFKEVLLYILEPVQADMKEWSAEDGLFIAAPAKDCTSALELAKELSQHSLWLSQTNWE